MEFLTHHGQATPTNLLQETADLFESELPDSVKMEVRACLGKAATQVLQTIAAEDAVVAQPLEKADQVRLCQMVAQHSLTEPGLFSDRAEEGKALWSQIARLLALPDAIAAVGNAGVTIERNVFETAIALLAIKYQLPCSALTSICHRQRAGSTDTAWYRWLTDESAGLVKKARFQLHVMLAGEVMLMPFSSVEVDQHEKEGVKVHFSAVMAVKTPKGFDFVAFDSSTDASENSDRFNIICQITPETHNRLFLFHKFLQHENDCAMQSYNFFDWCLSKKIIANIDSLSYEDFFQHYQAYLNGILGAEGDNGSYDSSMLRHRTLIDWVANGYTQDIPDRITRDSPLLQGTVTMAHQAAGEWGVMSKLWRSLSCLR
ncbi:hypothetical protein [Biostraticola tofi]|uniref:Uncharacterized protein n=1 Tax=Biostraticola tofi TaxID=466109 RepID=A0A4R3Z181_9GAMM|nr:hypothetical protein [Biostraticola tofi]TCV98816.1 hypothetical protein EDC52_102137 [Biostraticola tofi]